MKKARCKLLLIFPSHCTDSNQPIAVPSGTNITSSEANFGYETTDPCQPCNLQSVHIFKGNMQGRNTRGTTRDESNCEDLSIRCVLVLFYSSNT
ncbi:hypothetical protein OIU79_015817 [Salix purpurea]|uniref:Uncharacterized protein n=1 Tax=Salix purpurea TaxID=77065 RepID=A0A9Q0PD53_SALPP|nr:hypothetical protein OIU79_015817 [Salix purpurea]